MKVYKIDFDFNYAFGDIIECIDNVDSLDLKPERVELFSKFRYGWLTKESSIIPDFVIIMSELLGCKESLASKLSDFTNDASMSRIIVGNEPYMVFTNVPELDGCINLKKSEVTYFSPTVILKIRKPVFLPQAYPYLFKVKHISRCLFCNEDFMHNVVNGKLTGLSFEECKIKSKSLF